MNERERERMQETLLERVRDVGEYKHWLGVVVRCGGGVGFLSLKIINVLL